MQWKDKSSSRPGHRIYESGDSRYVIQRNSEVAGIWRLAHRADENQPLKIIYTADTLADCKTYADTYEMESTASQ